MSQLVRLEGKHTAQTAHCALVGSPVAGDVVSPARVARYWAALALTFILAENARGGAGAGAAEKEVVLQLQVWRMATQVPAWSWSRHSWWL